MRRTVPTVTTRRSSCCSPIDVSVYAIGVDAAVLNRGTSILSHYAHATGGDVYYSARGSSLPELYEPGFRAGPPSIHTSAMCPAAPISQRRLSRHRSAYSPPRTYAAHARRLLPSPASVKSSFRDAKFSSLTSSRHGP